MSSAGFLNEEIKNQQIQKVVREMVIESERKYKTLIENSLVGIIIYSEDHIVYANPRFNEMLGYNEDDYKNMQIWDFIHPAMRDEIRERAYRRIQGEDIPPEYELQAIKKDGTILDCLLRSARMNYQGKTSLIVNLVDITPLKSAMREVRELSTIVETALLPIIKIDSSGKILYINRNAEKFLNAELSDLRGRPLSDLISGIEPEEMLDHIIAQTGRGGFDNTILCKTIKGEPVRMRLTTCPLVNENDEMTAIACFLIDPAFHKAEENLLNRSNSREVG